MGKWIDGYELIHILLDGWMDVWIDQLIYRWIDRKMHSSLSLGSQSLVWALMFPTSAPTDSVAIGYSPDLLRNCGDGQAF